MILTVAAPPLLSVGAFLGQPVLIAFGVVAVVDGPMLLTATRVWRPPAP